MQHVFVLTNALRTIIPEGCDGLLTELEYYNKEDGYGIQGDCINFDSEFIQFMNYSGGINDNLSEPIRTWNYELANTSERWNKARIIVFRDGRTEVKSWWDEDFQKSLYSK